MSILIPLIKVRLGMKALAAIIGGGAVLAGGSTALVTLTGDGGSPNCGMQLATTPPAFCERFETASPGGGREGDLDGLLWGASRVTGYSNMGGGLQNAFFPAKVTNCSGQSPERTPPADIVVCGGQVHEGLDDDGHNVLTIGLYPKQPFDFAGRTGTVAFDVSNDTDGGHAAWPEFWLTDKPTPAPFVFGEPTNSWISTSANSLGIRFEHNAGGICPTGTWTAGSAVAVRNYVTDDSKAGGSLTLTPLACVTLSNGTTMNHIEIRIAQAVVDVYASDAGTTSPLKKIATIPNANLSFTRGLLWLTDAHYNAEKGPCHCQQDHQFAWDNVAFDGPYTYRDLSFDALDRSDSTNSDGSINLGWTVGPDSPRVVQIPGVFNIAKATSAYLMFNHVEYEAPVTFTYAVNGHSHTGAWPYAENGTMWRAAIFPVPLTDLVSGTNTASIFGSKAIQLANVNIVLVAAGDPPSTVTATSVPTILPTLTPTPAQSATPVPSPTATAIVTSTSTVPPSPTPTSIPPTIAPTATPPSTATAIPSHACSVIRDGVTIVSWPCN